MPSHVDGRQRGPVASRCHAGGGPPSSAGRPSSTTWRRSSTSRTRARPCGRAGSPSGRASSAPTVSATLQRLQRDGWITMAKDRSVTTTPKGEELAATVVRHHRLLERWLTDTLGLDWASADEEAQRLAPGLTDEVADRLAAHLGDPSTCPHGNVIPGRPAPYGELVRARRPRTGRARHRSADLRGGRARRAPGAPPAGGVRARAGHGRDDRRRRRGPRRHRGHGRRRDRRARAGRRALVWAEPT